LRSNHASGRIRYLGLAPPDWVISGESKSYGVRGIHVHARSKGDRALADPADEIESELVDLTELSLEQVRSLDGSVLGNALRRVVAEVDNPERAFAGFSQRI
jgi:FXSXX-COOH protein